MPSEVAGLKSTTFTQYEAVDLLGANSQDQGYGVIAMDNGDKVYVRFQGKTIVKKEGAFTGQGTWSYTRGTGKLKGLKGKGTYKHRKPPELREEKSKWKASTRCPNRAPRQRASNWRWTRF